MEQKCQRQRSTRVPREGHLLLPAPPATCCATPEGSYNLDHPHNLQHSLYQNSKHRLLSGEHLPCAPHRPEGPNFPLEDGRLPELATLRVSIAIPRQERAKLGKSLNLQTEFGPIKGSRARRAGVPPDTPQMPYANPQNPTRGPLFPQQRSQREGEWGAVGIPIDSSFIGCKVRPLLSLLQLIAYTPDWLPTAPRRAELAAALPVPYGWDGCVDALSWVRPCAATIPL